LLLDPFGVLCCFVVLAQFGFSSLLIQPAALLSGSFKEKASHSLIGVAMKTDGKTLFLLLFLYFLAKTGSGLEMESAYADARKRTNTDGDPEN
jgi:hypothetical protein